MELTFSKVVLIPAGLLNVELRVDPRLNVEFSGVDTLAKNRFILVDWLISSKGLTRWQKKLSMVDKKHYKQRKVT